MKMLLPLTAAPPCALLTLFLLTQLFGDVADPAIWLVLFGLMALTGLLVLLYLLFLWLRGTQLAGYETAALVAAVDLLVPVGLLALLIYALRHMRLML